MKRLFAKKGRRGITFVELLLVVSIVAIVGTAAVLSFRSGRDNWGSSDNQTEVIQNAVVGMEKVVREINNSPGLTSITSTAIRFKILRKNTVTDKYDVAFAMLKLGGADNKDLQYGERATDSATESDWILNTLSYPVTNLTFSFFKADGTVATTADEVKSVQISMITQKDGVSIPLVNQVYMRADNAFLGSGGSIDPNPADVSYPPVAVPDSYTIAEDTTLTTPSPGVLLNDTDADGDTLQAISLVTTAPFHGTASLNTNGSLTYTPDPNWSGVDTVQYDAFDATTPVTTTAVITVAPVNDASAGVPDAYTVPENMPTTVSAPGVLGNDTDIDGVFPLKAVKLTNPTRGTVTLNQNGSFTYTPTHPPLHNNGPDSFTYKVDDGGSGSTPTTVNLTVTYAPYPPVGNSDAYTVPYNTTLTVPVTGSPYNGVLFNDSDPDGDPITAINPVGPSHGALTLNANGSFGYIPTHNYSGADSFTYKVNDGTTQVATVVNLTVSPPPDFPGGEEALPPGTNPPPGSKGNGVGGWTIDDYCIYGHSGANLSNSNKIYGNVGTHGTSYNSQNSVEVHGYLVVYGTLNMSNSGAISGDSIAAAYTPSYGVNFANSARANSNLWTFAKVTMSNSSRINGTVHQPNTLSEPTITCHNSSGYTARVLEIPSYMGFLGNLFPALPTAEPDSSFVPNSSDENISSTTKTLTGNKYGHITVSGSSVLTLAPTTWPFNARNLSISNSSRVNMPSGNYYFTNINISNSSKIRFNFVTVGGNIQPIRIFMKDRFDLSNSSSFEFYKDGAVWSNQYEAARYIYVEPRNGLTCSNSVQWKGFVYVPNGNINFSNSTSLVGAAICTGTVNLANSVTATYVAPIYNASTKLLSEKFHP